MKEFYYYLRDNDNRPLVTVCLMQSNINFSRGVAICSNLDSPCKRVGRNIAHERASHAMKVQGSTCPMGREDAFHVINLLMDTPSFIGMDWKSKYMDKASLSLYETELIEKTGV
ncbi:hypothetical protein LCGC14_1565890 [marine sediment metagenome]|uniref:Uncharacterized protein n=1 Tax=marine sediment metagenome TaxID=412755 RepID=A0A0F9J7A8_9ZZZZ